MFSQLSYFSGAKPGLKRKITNDDDAKSKSKKYEEHRKERKFSTSWQAGRDWLCFDFVTNTMTCSVCKEFGQSQSGSSNSNLKNQNTFIMGCSNKRLSSVVDHESSKSHANAVLASKSKSMPTATSSAGKTLTLLKSAERHRLAYLFRNAHAVAKQNRPLSDYTWMCKLDTCKGLDVGNTYLNEKAALVFLSSVAEVEKEKTVTILKTAPFFSIMMDGSTDISGDEQETIFIRTSLKGQVNERFLHIGTPTSTSSSDLLDHVLETFDQFGLDRGKLVGMGSDGASNMTGVKSGLAQRLREQISDEIVNIHCLCHRLELAFRDVIKKSKVYDKLMTLLIGLHYFYKKSHKNKHGLLRAIDMLGGKGVLPPKVTGTRWLPHLHRGITCLVKTFTAYEAHLSTSSHQNPKAEGLFKIMVDKNVVAFMLFLQTVLDPLMKLSLKLQRTTTSLADSLMWVETTVELLEDSKSSDSDQLKEVLESGVLNGVKLKGPTPKMVYKEDLINGLKQAIEHRFKLLEDERNVVQASQILNLSHWPNYPINMRDFGNEDIKTVVDHYTNTLLRMKVFIPDEVLNEWCLLKKILTKRHGSNLKTLDWSTLLTVTGDDGDFNNITIIIDLLLSLPPTSVACETTFSQMKLIKTSRRTRLRPSTLNNLLLVKLESPKIENFEPEDSINKWLSTPGSRRSTYHREATQTATEVVSDDGAIVKVTVTEDLEDDVESDDEVDSINMLCGGDEVDFMCYDHQDELLNFEKILFYARD